MNFKSTIKLASRSWLIMVIMAFVAMMFFPAFTVGNMALRIIINAAVTIGSVIFAFSMGASQGDDQLTHGEMLDRRIANYGYQPTAEEESMRYSRKTGVVALILGALPWVILAIVVMVTGQGYDHVAAANAPEYMFPTADMLVMSPHQYVDVIARAAFAAFIGYFELIDNIQPGLLDQLFIYLSFLYPLAVFVGYLCGPRQHAKKLKMIEEGKQKKLRKIRAEQRRKRRQQQQREQKWEV